MVNMGVEGHTPNTTMDAAKKMQFFLKSVSSLGDGCGLRRGNLVWTAPNECVSSLDTPTCLLYSRAGSIPNLTRDIEETILSHMTESGCGNEAVMLTMSTMYMK